MKYSSLAWKIVDQSQPCVQICKKKKNLSKIPNYLNEFSNVLTVKKYVHTLTIGKEEFNSFLNFKYFVTCSYKLNNENNADAGSCRPYILINGHWNKIQIN